MPDCSVRCYAIRLIFNKLIEVMSNCTLSNIRYIVNGPPKPAAISVNSSLQKKDDNVTLSCGKPVNFTYYDDLIGIATRFSHPITPEPEVISLSKMHLHIYYKGVRYLFSVYRLLICLWRKRNRNIWRISMFNCWRKNWRKPNGKIHVRFSCTIKLVIFGASKAIPNRRSNAFARHCQLRRPTRMCCWIWPVYCFTCSIWTMQSIWRDCKYVACNSLTFLFWRTLQQLLSEMHETLFEECPSQGENYKSAK